MTNAPKQRHYSAPQDIIESISRFRLGPLSLAATLDRLWAEIHDLPEALSGIVGDLEDQWSEIEAVYALAAEAEQPRLDPGQASDVHASMDAIIAIMERAL